MHKNKNKLYIKRGEQMLYIGLTNIHFNIIKDKDNDISFVNELVQKYSSCKVLGQYFKFITNKQKKYHNNDAKAIYYAINSIYTKAGMYGVNEITRDICEYADSKKECDINIDKEEEKEPVKEYKFNIFGIKF